MRRVNSRSDAVEILPGEFGDEPVALEAATEKISSMVNSINSTQSMKMLDIHKFTNGRNEAYDLAVKVNNTKFDSLNALIKMIGER